MEVQERMSCTPIILNSCWCCAFCTGDAVEDAVKGALHLGNKDKDKNKKKGGGGIFSRTGGDKDKKKEVDNGEGKGGLFHREDEDEKERKSGFKGLFTEGPLPEAGGGGGAAMEGEGEEKPQSASANDGGTCEEQHCTSLRHTEATACSAASLYMATLEVYKLCR